MSRLRKKIEVVAAVIEQDEKYLCVQRGAHKYEYLSYKYEFPGGKVEPNELAETALKREIQEELNFKVGIDEFLVTVNYSYPDFDITMKVFLCRVLDDVEFTLTEHIDAKWLAYYELGSLDWADADIPIVNILKERE